MLIKYEGAHNTNYVRAATALLAQTDEVAPLFSPRQRNVVMWDRFYNAGATDENFPLDLMQERLN